MLSRVWLFPAPRIVAYQVLLSMEYSRQEYWRGLPFPQCRRPQFDSQVGKIRLRRDRLPTPVFLDFPYGSAGKESACNVRSGFDPWVGKIPWRREWLPIPVFWLGEFHGPYSPWGCKELGTSERLSLAICYLGDLGQVIYPLYASVFSSIKLECNKVSVKIKRIKTSEVSRAESGTIEIFSKC